MPNSAAISRDLVLRCFQWNRRVGCGGMTPEKLFHELLGLGLNWEVTECEYDRESSVVRLAVRETAQFWQVERSPATGAPVTCYDHTEEMTWRHLDVFEHQCDIRCRLPRARCTKTGKVYRVR